jgi:FHA domain
MGAGFTLGATAMPDVSYVPGPLVAVAGDQCWALIEASPDSPAVARIWQRLGQAPAAEAVLAGLLADGFGGVPSMALLATGADGQHRLFCRGAVGATVEARATAERVDGAGLLTWREQVVAGAERVILGEPPAGTALRLPATSGVLLAGCVVIDFTTFAARETASYRAVPLRQATVPAGPEPQRQATEPAGPEPQRQATVPAGPEPPRKTIVYFPDTVTVPPAGAASVPQPPPASWANQEGQEHVTAPGDPLEGLNGGGDGGYDFLWGATQARTVEDAAIRGSGDDDLVQPRHSPLNGAPVVSSSWGSPLPAGPPSAGYADPPPPTGLWRGAVEPPPGAGGPPRPPLPGQGGGLIDVPQWLAGPGESEATARRGDFPGPAAGTTPPDSIGPVVPALICASGHVNPPSIAACRRCAAPLPPDPVPVPRPVLGVLRLSLGDVITLDRGVLMGRNPQSDFAGPDGEERPHVVKLPAAGGDISRMHLRVTLDGWHVLVTDLNSTNGTLVTLPGREPRHLRPGEPTLIQPGAVVTLAEGVEFRYEAAD